jgi:hypothetical protein
MLLALSRLDRMIKHSKIGLAVSRMKIIHETKHENYIKYVYMSSAHFKYEIRFSCASALSFFVNFSIIMVEETKFATTLQIEEEPQTSEKIADPENQDTGSPKT